MLTAVKIGDGKIVGCNGKVLVIRETMAKGDPVLVPAEGLKRISPSTVNHWAFVSCEDSKVKMTADRSDSLFEADAIQGKYPDYEQLVPLESDAQVCIAFEVEELKRVLEIAHKDEDSSVIKFWIKDGKSPVKFKVGSKLTGVIMPTSFDYEPWGCNGT